MSIDPEYLENRMREIQRFEDRASGKLPSTRKAPGAAKMLATPEIATPKDLATNAANQRRERRLSTPASAAMVAPTPLSIVQAALASGNVEMYREAVALARDMDAIVSRKAFDNAMSAARAEIPVIKKNRRVGFDSKRVGASRTDYAHEDMAEIARTIDPILSKHGLSYRFRVSSNVGEPVRVTCVISHRDGHSEETTLHGARDESGNKNGLQAIGSTVTYLQRYTLKAALGLSAAEDDDGRASEAKVVEAEPQPGTISASQAADIRRLLNERGVSERAFTTYIRLPSIEHIGAEHFERARAKITSMGVRT